MLLLTVIIVWNVALAGALGWLIIVVRERTTTAARVFEIHTEMLRRIRGEMAAAKSQQELRYRDAVSSLPTDLVLPDVDGFLEAARHRKAEHDATVRQAEPLPVIPHRCAGFDHCNEVECEHDEEPWTDTGTGPGFPNFTRSVPPK